MSLIANCSVAMIQVNVCDEKAEKVWKWASTWLSYSNDIRAPLRRALLFLPRISPGYPRFCAMQESPHKQPPSALRAYRGFRWGQ